MSNNYDLEMKELNIFSSNKSTTQSSIVFKTRKRYSRCNHFEVSFNMSKKIKTAGLTQSLLVVNSNQCDNSSSDFNCEMNSLTQTNQSGRESLYVNIQKFHTHSQFVQQLFGKNFKRFNLVLILLQLFDFFF